MILLIDNYDSFSYNLYQLVGSINPDIKVIRNDAYTCEEIEAMNPERIIISPGPGKPKDAGICEDVIRYFKGRIPILGVCLGHQAICETFDATVTYAKQLMHGKQSVVSVDNSCKLFKNLADKAAVARYHSLAATKETIPDCLEITAITTPVMPYLWMVLAVAQEKYMPDIAIGTLVSSLVPLGLALQVIWIIFLIAWTLLGIPIGPGVGATLPPGVL